MVSSAGWPLPLLSSAHDCHSLSTCCVPDTLNSFFAHSRSSEEWSIVFLPARLREFAQCHTPNKRLDQGRTAQAAETCVECLLCARSWASRVCGLGREAFSHSPGAKSRCYSLQRTLSKGTEPVVRGSCLVVNPGFCCLGARTCLVYVSAPTLQSLLRVGSRQAPQGFVS